MSALIQITVTDTASQVLVNLKPEVLLPVVAKVIDTENTRTVSHIQDKYLSFPKQGPTTLAGLRIHSTPGFRSTLHATPSTISGSDIISAIGTPQTKGGFSYPSLHEFGGVVHHPARRSSVRLRTTRSGDLMRQGKNKNLAVFARRSHTAAKTIPTEIKAHDATYPARAPIQKGLADRADQYTKAISEKILSGGNA